MRTLEEDEDNNSIEEDQDNIVIGANVGQEVDEILDDQQDDTSVSQRFFWMGAQSVTFDIVSQFDQKDSYTKLLRRS